MTFVSDASNGESGLVSLFGLAGRKAVVTGAGRGIGQAIAVALHAAGASVVVVDQDEESVQAATQPLGLNDRGIVLDLSTPFSIDTATQSMLQHVDIFVGNAGTMLKRPFAETGRHDFAAMMDLHVLGNTELLRCVLPGMKARGYGRIILLASIAAWRSRVPTPAYSAAKGALISLVRSLAHEYGPFGVTCNAIAPGPIRTAMSAAAHADPDIDAAIRSRIPVGRWGEPEDIAPLAVLLAGSGGAFVSGETITVDGGASTNV